MMTWLYNLLNKSSPEKKINKSELKLLGYE